MTVALVAVPATVAEIPPGLETTVKLVAATPVGVHRTVADTVPGVADMAVGAPGGEMAALATGALTTEEAATHATAKTAPANRRKLWLSLPSEWRVPQPYSRKVALSIKLLTHGDYTVLID